MSDAYTEVAVDENDIEVFEETYFIEEEDDSECTMDAKQEYNKDIIFDNDKYAHIVCLGKDEETGEDVYHCALCNTTFTSVWEHVRDSHSEDNEYDENIKMCVKEEIEDVEDEEECSQHEQMYEEEVVKATDILKVETKVADIVCQSCRSIFQTMDEAESHQCVVVKTESIGQDPAPNTENADSVQIQINGEDPNSVFSCGECPRLFMSINALQQHQRTHNPNMLPIKKKRVDKSDSKSAHCEICNTTFTSTKNLKLHVKMHRTLRTKTIKEAMPIGTEESKNRDQFYCEMCNKSFDHSLLSIHQNMHQNLEEYTCGTCNRQFENQISYDMHMQLHTDHPTQVRKPLSKPGARFSCNYCGREFQRPHEKVKHERVHTGEKPYECEACGKCFRVPYSLTLHLRTHTDVRPFVCAQCNKRFKSYAVYVHHLNIHSEDRPYKCPMCPKSFRTSVQLCGHRNSHTKPYNCPECNRPFASMYAVKMHMKTHNKANKSNENLKHRCGICGAVYARMFALRYHMKEQHSTDMTEEELKNGGTKQPPVTADDTYNEDEVSAQAIMQGEEIIIDSFPTEEIVTDWLANK